MAERENIKDRARRLNLGIQALNDRIDAALREQGYEGNIVELTEDMTPEEEEMAIFAGLIKEGCSPEEAEVKAKEKLKLLRKVFNYQRNFSLSSETI
jgi:hypothetical protein